jgi:hypothetical protein
MTHSCGIIADRRGVGASPQVVSQAPAAGNVVRCQYATAPFNYAGGVRLAHDGNLTLERIIRRMSLRIRSDIFAPRGHRDGERESAIELLRIRTLF